jgi:pilus assembly protein CpaD
MFAVNDNYPHKASGQRAPRRRARTLLALLTLALAGSGCASYERNHYITGAVPDDYRTRHPIVVRQDETAEDIVVSPNARELSYRDRAVALAFVSRFKQSGAAQIAVLIPTGSANEVAARHVARQIVVVFAERGISRDRISLQPYSAGGHGDAATIRMVYAGIVAEVPTQCGQWGDDVLNTAENRNYENFGCATQKNLAAMVANPADLLAPRGESEIDATRRTNVINTWREDGTGDLPTLF